MIRFALVKVGLDAETFWGMTWAEYRYACDHYWHKKELAYEQSRFTAFWVAAPFSDGQISDPSDLIELSIDAESVDMEVVEAENAQTLATMQDFHQKLLEAKKKKTFKPAPDLF